MRYILALILFILLLPTVSIGAVLTFSCKYPTYSSDEGGLKKDGNMAFELSVDTTTGEAFMKSNLGMTKLDLHIGYSSWTLYVKLDTGAVQTTTIVKDSLVSVPSRNSVIFNELSPSQYYGKCKLL